MQANQISFSRMFSTTGVIEHYHVPKYQREYTWGKGEWNQFLQDIEENEKQYFMGSLICIKQESGGGHPTIYDLVDGQQRLTTLSILLAAWLNKYNKLTTGSPDEDMLVNRSTVKKMLVQFLEYNGDQRVPKHQNQSLYLRIRPSTQGNNLDDYKFLLQRAGVIDDIEKQKFWGNRRIGLCYNHFKRNLPESRDELEELKDKIESLNFIHITADSQADAFVLFESLNNRGVPLSIMDIIKNKMLAELESKGQLNIDEAFEKWKQILEYLPDYGVQERFLRHYYNAYRDERDLELDNAPRAMRSNLVKIYEGLIDSKNTKELLSQIIKSANIYSSLVYPEQYHNEDIKRYLKELSYLGAAPAFAFILYFEELKLFSIEEKVKILRLLSNYFFRRSLTDKPPTRSLDKIFLDLINDTTEFNFQVIENHLTKNDEFPISSIQTVKEQLGRKIYATNKDVTRFALYKIETALNDPKTVPDLWKRNASGRLIWTVEHILPQNENMRDEWVQMLANGDRKEAREIQERVLHLLGNLTLTPYNSKLMDKPFKDKQTQQTTNIHGNSYEAGLKSNLALNHSIEFQSGGKITTLRDAENWSQKEIKNRTEVMINILLGQIKFSWE